MGTDIFAPIMQWLISKDRPTTNKEIASHSGIDARRVSWLRKHPNRATLGELEALSDAFSYQITIGRR